ncbi:hypothetical protein [Micromonospora sp. NPDC126480]|uniref:hypothetical protein n=1 Tax=Micromonospora sp. NPDC126480 TaxID=3155312 RepID=UPI003320E0F2
MQIDRNLHDDEYLALASFLQENPQILLRAFGFDQEMAKLEFLRWFPSLRKFSLAGLHHVTTLEGLRYLPADLAYLDLGETAHALDLEPAMRFERLRTLRVVQHVKGLVDLLQVNKELRALALWRHSLDGILQTLELPRLESLALTLGSLKSDSWVSRVGDLHYLAVRGTRGVTTVDWVRKLRSLKWLWLDDLSKVGRLPDLSANVELLRVDLTDMRNLREADSLESLRNAPNLEELLITESRLPVEAFRPLVDKASLRRVGVGLGSQRRNEDAQTLLARPAPSSLTDFSSRIGVIQVV